MTDEVKAVVSFGTLRRGDRLQVDIHDPQVAGLIKGGYLKVIWKERGNATSVDNSDDPVRPELVPAGSVGSGVAREPEEEDVDGQGGHRSDSEGADGE